MKKARLFLVRGRVQGVGYRFFAERRAHELGILGTVRNLSDGRVEVYATGDETTLEDFRKQLEEGPLAARVENVEEQEAPWKRFRNFSIEG